MLTKQQMQEKITAEVHTMNGPHNLLIRSTVTKGWSFINFIAIYMHKADNENHVW